MKKMYKAMLLVLCAILLVVGSVMGTLAYLQMSTQTVTNTFTVGNVKITLTERKMQNDGVTASDIRIDVTNNAANNAYKLIPGKNYTKDPKVTVVADSEACYVFVKVENGISAIEIAANDGDTIVEQMANNGWTSLPDVANVYYKQVDATTAKSGTTLPIFDTFTIDDNANNNAIWNLLTDDNSDNDPVIAITAYAIQSEGFNNAQEAWEASGFDTP